MSVRKVGLLVGRERSWPPRFIEELNARKLGIAAEFVRLGGTRMSEPVDYVVLIDRISHEVPYYRTYLKHAVLQTAYYRCLCIGRKDVLVMGYDPRHRRHAQTHDCAGIRHVLGRVRGEK